MKNKYMLIISVLVIAMFFLGKTVKADTEIYKLSPANYKIVINERDYKDNTLPVLNYKGSTYAPMRSMLEAAGLKVSFTNGVVIIDNGGTPVMESSNTLQTQQSEYSLTKASYKVIIKGKDYKDDNFPILNYKGSTYAPMRSMLEAAEFKVDFKNGIANVETTKNITNKNPNINDYLTIREIFEYTNITPSFNKDGRIVELYNDQQQLILVIPKEVTHEFDKRLLILKSYYESTLKPLIDKYKK